MLSTHRSKFALGSQPDLRFLFDLNGDTEGQGAPTSSMRRDGEYAQPRDGRRRSATTPERPPAISVVPPAPRCSRPTETRTPPGSPMDVDYEPPSSPPKPRRPVISVFDWDDTVCPSSWLHREGLLAAYKLVDGPVEPQDSSFGGEASESSPHEMSPGHRLALHQFEEHVIALLQYARQFGPVFIVTAAKLQWVRSCAEYFLPRVLQTLIKSETVHVISAREFYLGRKQRSAAPLGPGDEGTPLAWKATTFNAICTHLRVDEVAQRRAQSSPSRSSRVNFISVGDSFSERDACRMLELSAPSVMRSKTVKYLEQPHVLELMDQVRMTRVIYEQICRHAGGLDLHMVRSRGSIQVLQVDTPGQAPSTARSNPSPRRHSVATGDPIGTKTPL